jgi:hypothetical protein
MRPESGDGMTAGTLVLQCAILSALCSAANAADRDGNYAVWGPGARSCHSYNQSSAEAERAPYRNYVMGYLTAYNAVSTDTYAISAGMDLDAVMTWLDDYCAEKAMHSFEQALIGFTSDHAANRYQQPPGRGSR